MRVTRGDDNSLGGMRSTCQDQGLYWAPRDAQLGQSHTHTQEKLHREGDSQVLLLHAWSQGGRCRAPRLDEGPVHHPNPEEGDKSSQGMLDLRVPQRVNEGIQGGAECCVQHAGHLTSLRAVAGGRADVGTEHS